MINGKKYSWEDITINLPHGKLIDVEDIEYSDKKEKEAIYGKGSNPVGYGVGNYSADFKLTLAKEEFDRFNEYAKGQAKSLYRVKPFPITVSYASEDSTTKTDTLPNCTITDIKNSAKQGDKGLKVELSGLILDPIERDGFTANDDI